jgi:DNA-binding winged helix-turn-helix (wHTH) protein/Tol biopolymer transport system component
MDALSSPDYEFAGFRLNTSLQVLICPGGDPIPLPSRVFATLRYLVERSGETVDRAALMSEVWPSTVVADNNLNQCILKLRKALGESSGDRRFILTVPGRGFKFVAPVTVLPRDQHPPTSAVPTPVPPPAAIAAEVHDRAAVGPTASWIANLERWRWVIGGAITCVALAVPLATWLMSSAPHSVGSPAEFQPLTDLSDSATAPVLSPDGRMLAFIRNGPWMLSLGQIWLKVLPNGEYVRLTNGSEPLFAPTFSPDNSKVAYTIVSGRMQSWDTWTVPISGGPPAKLLSNSSGLTYIGPHEVMYSEFKTGIHLGIVTATEERSAYRPIYWPIHERAMAHFSRLSPDRKTVLVVEMDGTGTFDRCRLVPFTGASNGLPVGPAGACLAAAWSADGKWMFFSVNIAGHSHLWRQRFPQGELQQITFGPTEEETVSTAPDGLSLLTSIGTRQDTLWIHNASGDRVLTTEGRASSPWLSPDARRVYFLSASNSDINVALSRIDVATGAHEALLPEFNVMDYDVAPDEQQVVFTTFREGASQLWLAPLDRHAPPKLLVRGADQPHFGGGSVFYRSLGASANYLHRINFDGNQEAAVLSSPIVQLQAVAPDGRFVIVDRPEPGLSASAWMISVRNRTERLLGKGWFPAQLSRDGKLLYFGIEGPNDAQTVGRTAVVHIDADGLPIAHELLGAPDTELIPQPEETLSAGQDPSIYAYVKTELRRNIYRIPLH